MKTRSKLFLGLLVGLLLAAGGVSAATSYDVFNEPQLYLNNTISTTSTTITLAAPVVNRANVNMLTTTGGILRIRQGTKTEDIYYSSASINSTTKVVTLSGVIRNICRSLARVIQTCGAGQQFSRGATVELTVDARLLNLKANIDRPNTFTASGGVSFTQSGSLALPTFANTTTRDRQLGANPAGPVRVGCSTADGACYLYIAGAWTTIGSSTTINATETAAGKVELATIKDQSGAVVTGDSGAVPVVQTKYLTLTGSSADRYGRIPTLSKTGILTGSILGTGNKNVNSGRTHVSGTGSWVADPASPTSFAKYTASTGSAIIIQGAGTGDQNFSTTYQIPVADMGTGSTFLINITGTGGNTNGRNIVFKIKLGGTTVTTFDALGTTVNGFFTISEKIVFRTVGANGSIMSFGRVDYYSNSSTVSGFSAKPQNNSVVINTTSDLTIQPTISIQTDDGISKFQIKTMDVTRLAP